MLAIKINEQYLHVRTQSSSVTKLFELPSQPPYMKTSHLDVNLLKKYRGKWALQGPVFAGWSHTGRARSMR